MNLYLYKIKGYDHHMDAEFIATGFTFGANFVDAMTTIYDCYAEQLSEVIYIKELDSCTDFPIYEVSESILGGIENEYTY